MTDLNRDGLVVRVGFFVRDRGGIIANVIGRGKGVGVCVVCVWMEGGSV